MGANLAGWHVGQNIGGGVDARIPGSEISQLPMVVPVAEQAPAVGPDEELKNRLAARGVDLAKAQKGGAQATDLAFGRERMVEELAERAQQVAAGELAS